MKKIVFLILISISTMSAAAHAYDIWVDDGNEFNGSCDTLSGGFAGYFAYDLYHVLGPNGDYSHSSKSKAIKMACAE